MKLLKDVSTKIDSLFESGITKGKYLGFPSLHDYYSFKPQSTTYIYGSPFSGKTEIWFEMLMNLSEFYGMRHAIYTPESGSPSEIYAELISKYCRKPFYKNIPGHMSETEMLSAKDFIGEYFYVIDNEEDLTIEGFFDKVKEIEKYTDKKIDTTCCDPFNELKHNFDDMRQDLYIENKLGFIRTEARKNNRHNVIITHSAAQQPILKDGKTFYPPPSPRQISGGLAWHRKAMNLVCIWRPIAGSLDEQGQPYLENEVHFIVQKYKPKGVGRLGKVVLFYDQYSGRYYERNGLEKTFAKKEQPIQTIIPTYEF